VSPSGLINIVNYCRKITERLLIRERVLCKGYLTKGQIYHEGMMFFGSGYQEALDGEKYAAGVEWDDGILGMPFIEIASSSVMPYLKAIQDECIKKQFEGMTFSRDHYIVISPYGVFDRLINWAIKPNCKTVDTMHKEIASARDLIDKLESNFQSAKVSDNRAKEKVRVNLEQLLQVREKLAQADNMIQVLSSPFP
jgi:hypothetical protein